MAAPGLLSDNVPLAPLTTLGLGGAARFFADAHDENDLRAALAFARERQLPVFILGGGSNLVVADEGFDGLVVRIGMRGVSFHERGADQIDVTVAAGEPWDAFVATCCARGLAGLECLSGIPGLAGATPIQNVGAYGQEVADTIASLRVLDRARDVVDVRPAEACGFGYRASAFRRAPDAAVVLDVTFSLFPRAPATPRYAELARALDRVASPSLDDVRRVVLALRAQKSMVIDPSDENRRSAGSFFTNPIVSDACADDLVARAVADGLVARATDVPRFAAATGTSKLAAGWLIERAGFTRGLRRGAVGISSRHALALVHHGGGTTSALVALAREIRDGVKARFGVTLTPEPIFLGLTWT